MFPSSLYNLTSEAVSKIAEITRSSFVCEARRQKIDNRLEEALIACYIPLAAIFAQAARTHDVPLIVGINGAQGAGKSTLCRLLKIVLEQGFAQKVAILSLDDIYLAYTDRLKLAKEIHPLFVTRGVPGTHDVELGLKLLKGLRSLQKGESLQLPVFDKALDDRLPKDDWRQATGPFDLILFEGWCVGAMPQNEESLSEPINSLESEEDPDLTWRRYVNRQLQEGYRRLFAEIDCLVMLKVPGMESVLNWRGLQEQKLAVSSRVEKRKTMDAAELQRFIMHYERLTRVMLEEMPDRVPLVLELNSEHQIDKISCNAIPLAKVLKEKNL